MLYLNEIIGFEIAMRKLGIRMVLNYFLKRFGEMRSSYVGTNVTFRQNLFYVVDYVFALIFCGASISDYFAYGFYKTRRSIRNDFITFRRYKKIQKIANDSKYIDVFRDKVHFNKYFEEYLGRKYLSFEGVSKEKFNEFIKCIIDSHSNLFVKDIYSERGMGVIKLDSQNMNSEELYDKLLADKKNYVLEEEIKQHKALCEFHPWSVNTIRVVTLYDTIEDKVHIMNARLRIGNNRNSVDNFHFQGIGANVDIETGVINSVGYNVKNETFIFHPVTKKQIIGFQIPFWSECKNFVTEAAKKIPQVRYVGWDIVLLENGKFALIEGNDNADHDFQQLYNRGLWRDYKKILNNMKKK